MKHAVLFGASGFVGSFLLKELLDNPAYGRVTVVVRRHLDVAHPKLHVLTGDNRSLSVLADVPPFEDLFLALGTTRRQTPDRNEYYRIDHDYPVAAARIAKARGARSVFIVTAVGADAGSGIFYTRTKGETERDILALDFDHTHIFRPSMILGRRDRNLPSEKAFLKIWPVIDPLFVGGWSRFKGMEAKDIARAMNRAAGLPADKINIYHRTEMRRLS